MSLSGYRPSDRLRGRRIPDALLRDLPKTDLLFHLDGSLRPGTYAELARAAGEDVPDDAAALRRHVMGGAARPSPTPRSSGCSRRPRGGRRGGRLDRRLREAISDRSRPGFAAIP